MEFVGALEVFLEMGLIFSVLAMGYYVSYSILDFPDLTVEGTFLTGAVVFGLFVANGLNPWLGLVAAFLSGCLFGGVTGLLHVKLKIRPLLCGILVSTALITVNLVGVTAGTVGDFRAESSSIISFGRDAMTLNDAFFGNLIPARVAALGNVPLRQPLIFLVVAVACKVLLDLYLNTKNGLLLRATGTNEQFVKMLAVDPGKSKIIGLAIGNGCAAIAGALYTHTVDGVNQSMGLGMVIIGLASLIIGLSVFKKVRFLKSTTKVIFGAIIYQACLVVVQRFGIPSAYNKFIMAVLFTLVLILGGRQKKQGGVSRVNA
ncbi:MAG: ABC transporter permease [Oscillospiraceae bacterium]|nr:ABC transporter permease [Oscillospiraceae bacterium]